MSNHPRSQEDVVSNWMPVHSLLKDATSGAEIALAPCLLTLSVECLPLCLQSGRDLYGSWLAVLWYSLSAFFLCPASSQTKGLCLICGREEQALTLAP